MTLHDLTRAITFQGNIEIIKFNENEDTQSWFIKYTSNLLYDMRFIDNFEEIEDLEVTYIYSKNEDNDVLTVIEIFEEA